MGIYKKPISSEMGNDISKLSSMIYFLKYIYILERSALSGAFLHCLFF